MKSKTKIKKQTQRKFNPELVKTINLAKKNPAWKNVAEILSGPRQNYAKLNLNQINEKAEDKKIIIVPGKVLSMGEINKKIKIASLNFSENSKEKLKKSGCEITTILNEIKSNSEGKNIQILKK
ncbi:MAG: 50S ribosomal protein L18e [Nanoarchaeota archaeon]